MQNCQHIPEDQSKPDKNGFQNATCKECEAKLWRDDTTNNKWLEE